MIEMRPLAEDDLPAVRHVDEWAFGTSMSQARWSVASGVLERDRQVGAFVDGRLVGHTAALSQTMSVPGAVVPCAGITWVGVLPEYRRRGVMAALLRSQMGDLATSGEPVAALWAAEPGIYGRFGYGAASRRLSVTVPRPTPLAPVLAPVPGDLSVALGDVADMLDDCAAVYERVRPARPGMVTRRHVDWLESSFDDPQARGDDSPLRCALARERGEPVGYVWFRTKPRWRDAVPEGTVEVAELLACSPAADAALLRVVLDLDLTVRTAFWNLPLDHPLLRLTEASRRLAPRVADQLWVRLVRLDEALAARRYAADVDVVLDVTDTEVPDNAGRWRLAAGPDGAVVARTTAPADMVLDVAELGAAYLGDDSLTRALLAGQVDEHADGAGAALARAMRGDRTPFCPYMF